MSPRRRGNQKAEQGRRDRAAARTRRASREDLFEIGGVLSAIQKNEWFDPFASLDEWVEKNMAISRAKARALIQICYACSPFPRATKNGTSMQRGPDCHSGSQATAGSSASARSRIAEAPTSRPAPPAFSFIMVRRRRWLAAMKIAIGLGPRSRKLRLIFTYNGAPEGAGWLLSPSPCFRNSLRLVAGSTRNAWCMIQLSETYQGLSKTID